MNNKTVKIVSVGLSVLGAAIGVVGNLLSEKQQDNTIAEKVAEAIAKQSGKES